ncbi:MAG TPA: hypothetical protein ENK66_07515, partial [Arcobacter sp.]|nr:hypothetical protein [Arcobacter sp.]
MYNFLKIFLLLLSFLTILMASEIPLDNTTKGFSLLEKSRIYIDHNATTEPMAIIQKSHLFKKSNQSALNLGATREKVWVEIKLHNQESYAIKKILLLKDPSLEHIYLYNQKGELLQKTGVIEYQPPQQTLFFYLPIELEANEHKTLYLEIYNEYVPLGFSLFLEDEKEYLHADSLEQMVDIFLLGMISALVLYSVVMGVYLKEASYFFYALYLSTLLYMMFAYLGFSPLLFSKSFTLVDLHLTIYRVYS